MVKYVSPGVYIQERDISVVKYSKRYLRREKIRKILGPSDVSDDTNVIITSTPKGPTNFTQIY